jgi:hypothetical protein
MELSVTLAWARAVLVLGPIAISAMQSLVSPAYIIPFGVGLKAIEYHTPFLSLLVCFCLRLTT